MKEIRLANKIIRTLVKDRMQYPGRLITDTFALIARCGILLILYWYVFKLNGGAVNGSSYLFVAWSMFLYFAFMVFRLRDISKLIMQDIKTGNIEVLLSKPISYLAYKVWWSLGSGIYSFIIAFALGSVALVLIIGIPQTMTSLFFISTFSITFILTSILTLLIYGSVGLLSFWIEEVTPVFWIVDKAVMILGGSYLPIALFPKFMYLVALYSPFGASQFITHTVYESWSSNWYYLISIQIFWIIIFSIGVYFMFKTAQKRISVNGG